MGIAIEIDNLDDLCNLMCDNIIPKDKVIKEEDVDGRTKDVYTKDN